MSKVIAILVLCLLPCTAAAHEDRVFPIEPDGTLSGLPSEYGPVKVKITYSLQDPRVITRVSLSSPNFRIKLNPCVLDKLRSVTHTQASGSWYHDLQILPPYVSLTFYTSDYAAGRRDDFYSITFSLVDGQILGALRAWDPWWGSPRGEHIRPANKCSGWG